MTRLQRAMIALGAAALLVMLGPACGGDDEGATREALMASLIALEKATEGAAASAPPGVAAEAAAGRDAALAVPRIKRPPHAKQPGGGEARPQRRVARDEADARAGGADARSAAGEGGARDAGARPSRSGPSRIDRSPRGDEDDEAPGAAPAAGDQTAAKDPGVRDEGEGDSRAQAPGAREDDEREASATGPKASTDDGGDTAADDDPGGEDDPSGEGAGEERAEPAPPPPPPPLAIDGTLSLAKARELTEEARLVPRGALGGLSPSPSYNSVEFAAPTKLGFGVSLQVWRDANRGEATRRFRRLRAQYPGADTTDALRPHQAFYSAYKGIQSLTFVDNRRHTVVSVACGERVCTQAQLLALAEHAGARL